jgi:hypothetical protein
MTSQECVWFEPSMTTDNSMILTRLRKKLFFQTDSNSKISLSWYKCQVYCLLYWKLKYVSPDAFEYRATQSIGVLSFTFLRSTGHDDIVVPMVSASDHDQGLIIPFLKRN